MAVGQRGRQWGSRALWRDEGREEWGMSRRVGELYVAGNMSMKVVIITRPFSFLTKTQQQ